MFQQRLNSLYSLTNGSVERLSISTVVEKPFFVDFNEIYGIHIFH